jgi:putative acetyltransferase
MAINIIQTDSTHPDFLILVNLLDENLAIQNGDKNDFFKALNTLNTINHVLIAYENGVASSCGAIKAHDDETMEVKRMFTLPEMRGKGIASKVLNALGIWAKELGAKRCVLETLKSNDIANKVYYKSGYSVIPNYPPYQDEVLSHCMEKWL